VTTPETLVTGRPGPIAVDDRLLAELASFIAPGHAPATSLMLDLSADGEDVASRVKTLLRTARLQAANVGGDLFQALVLHDRARLADQLLSRFEELDLREARGLAAYAAGGAYWRLLPLAAPLEDTVRLQPTLYLSPLVRLAAEAGGGVVAAVDRDGGRLYRPQAGTLVPIGELPAAEPAPPGSRGSEQRLREVADGLVQAVTATEAPWIAVARSGAWKAIAPLLDRTAAKTLVEHIDSDPHRPVDELAERIAAPVAAADRKAELDGMDRWREEAGRGELAATGWDATLNAISDGRVEILWLAPGRRAAAYLCHRCGRLAAETGRCPTDAAPLRRYEDGTDQAVRSVYAQGGTVRPVRYSKDLDPVGGVGALLRF
jgi:hypothetical protein